MGDISAFLGLLTLAANPQEPTQMHAEGSRAPIKVTHETVIPEGTSKELVLSSAQSTP